MFAHNGYRVISDGLYMAADSKLEHRLNTGTSRIKVPAIADAQVDV